MYVEKRALTSARDIEQGDLLVGFLLPEIAGAKALHRRPPKSQSTLALSDAEFAAEPEQNIRVQVAVKASTVLVVGNSCDISGGGTLILAPVSPLKLQKDPNTNPVEAFEEIRRRATSGNWSKSFYLGVSQKHSVGERCEAVFDQLITLSPTYVQRLIEHRKLKRHAGLNPDGVAHLRWALGYFFGRNAREELDWQADEDLLLRLRYLEAIKTDGSRRREGFEAELAATQKEIDRRGIAPPVPSSAEKAG